MSEEKAIFPTEIIEGVEYVLQPFFNNSAPCSQCAFFSRSELSCVHPDKGNRHCARELGTSKGWNTLEYVRYNKYYHGLKATTL